MPITAQDFRKLALAVTGAVESAHNDHPDFRLHGRIFASLGYPDDNWGMVKLTPKQQAEFLKGDPTAFQPCKGVWGQRGATNVYLAAARRKIVHAALKAAAQNITDATAPKMKGRSAALRRSGNNPFGIQAGDVIPG